MANVDIRALTGSTFHYWAIGKELGRGDSAIVYEAQHGDVNAAIKIFFPEALSKFGFEEEQERLELQLQLRGPKQHPNLVQILDGGISDGAFGRTLYLVMERVHGATLDKLIHTIPRAALAGLARQLASAAQFLEQKGLVHRDIKPANIVISPDASLLTLLDLGILKTIAADDAQGRLSGMRFVATPRYSPPEFVWRTEDETPEGYRAITFYQIGGVLHDVIMKKPLFQGEDQPPAKLYDCIKFRTPVIRAPDCEQWLCVLAECCLLKDWRERLRLVAWESFNGPADDQAAAISLKQTAIRVRQVRRQEMESAAALERQGKMPKDRRVAELWALQDEVVLETRRYLTSSLIFPRFSSRHQSNGPTSYRAIFDFEPAPDLGFENSVTLDIRFEWDSAMGEATALALICEMDGANLYEGKWVEKLTVATASSLIKTALLQVVDRLFPDEEGTAQ